MEIKSEQNNIEENQQPSSNWLITGATGGLGSAFAIEAAEKGFDLVLSDLHPEGSRFAEYLSNEYEITVHYHPCDLTSPKAREEFYQTLAGEGYRFRGLINVAGLDHEGGMLERNRDQLLQIVRLNIEATLDTTYTVLKMRDEKETFRLINVFRAWLPFTQCPIRRCMPHRSDFYLISRWRWLRKLQNLALLLPFARRGCQPRQRRCALFSRRVSGVKSQLLIPTRLHGLPCVKRCAVSGWLSQVGSIASSSG